jgi:hypothetical protein
MATTCGLRPGTYRLPRIESTRTPDVGLNAAKLELRQPADPLLRSRAVRGWLSAAPRPLHCRVALAGIMSPLRAASKWSCRPRAGISEPITPRSSLTPAAGWIVCAWLAEESQLAELGPQMKRREAPKPSTRQVPTRRRRYSHGPVSPTAAKHVTRHSPLCSDAAPPSKQNRA